MSEATDAVAGGVRIPRRELMATIEKHETTIAKYETRLRDVVRAYKGVVKEKDALEASLKVLKGVDEAKPEDDVGKDGKGADSEESSAEEASSSVEQLKSRIKTLTSSLATMAEEKSRMESSFQEDRKKLVQEGKQRDRQIDSLKAEVGSVKANVKKELEEAKSKLIVERHERERETGDHALMLKELQKLVSDERRAKEQLEAEVFELRGKTKTVEVAGAKNENMEQKIKELERRLKDNVEKLDRQKSKAKESSVEVERLKKSIFDQKLTHRKNLEKAEQKAEQAEARAVEARLGQEQRVTNLEARLQELSETVGTYDRLRQHDQQEIGKLREKLAAAAVDGRHQQEANRVPEFGLLAMPALLDSFYALKDAIKRANVDGAVDTETLFGDGAQRWKAEYESLRDEFDEFRRQERNARAEQQQQPSPNGGRYLLPEVDQQVVLTLKVRVSDLEDRIAMLSTQLAEGDAERTALRAKETDLREEMVALKKEHREQQLAAESEHRSRMMQLESELQKQRDRCLTLIEEKEDEVSMLKSNMAMAFESAFSSPDREAQLRLAAVNLRSSSGGVGAGSSAGHRSRKASETLTEGLLRTSSLGGSSGAGDGGMVLHYQQELSHKDVEISGLRTKVSELESAMREIQTSFLAKEERYVDRTDRLEAEVARLSRMTSVEGANLEYLKNVVLRYMLCSDAAGKEHMLKAIGAVLLFTRQEVRQVTDFNASWWRWRQEKK